MECQLLDMEICHHINTESHQSSNLKLPQTLHCRRHLHAMSFVNNYKHSTPSKPDLTSMLNPAVPFDVNFVYDVKELQNERIRLVPFVVCDSTSKIIIH